MEKPVNEPAFGFDTNWQMRVPAELVTRMHTFARSRGITASAWVRMLICEALEDAENRASRREAA